MTVPIDATTLVDAGKQIALILFLTGALKEALSGLVVLLRPGSDEAWLNDHFGKVCAALVGLGVGWLDASVLGVPVQGGVLAGVINAAFSAGFYFTGIPSATARGLSTLKVDKPARKPSPSARRAHPGEEGASP